ncbi:hypothetical protein RI367_004963 [Sorochytrium milnesiophthora]
MAAAATDTAAPLDAANETATATATATTTTDDKLTTTMTATSAQAAVPELLSSQQEGDAAIAANAEVSTPTTTTTTMALADAGATSPVMLEPDELKDMRHQLERLAERLRNEQERNQEMENTKRLIDSEYESLSVQLFEQANLLVKQERVQRSQAEKRAVQLEQRLHDSDVVVDSLQSQLAELKQLLLQKEEEEADAHDDDDDGNDEEGEADADVDDDDHHDGLRAMSPSGEAATAATPVTSPLQAEFPSAQTTAASTPVRDGGKMHSRRTSESSRSGVPRGRRGSKPRLAGDGWKADVFPMVLGEATAASAVIPPMPPLVHHHSTDSYGSTPRRQSTPKLGAGANGSLDSDGKLPRSSSTGPIGARGRRASSQHPSAIPQWAHFALGPHEYDFTMFIRMVLTPPTPENTAFTTMAQKEATVNSARYMRRIYTEDIEPTLNFENPTWLQKKKLMSAVTSHQLVITTKHTPLARPPPKATRKFSVASALVGGSLSLNSSNVTSSNSSTSLSSSDYGNGSAAALDASLETSTVPLRCFGCSLTVRNEPPLYTIRLAEGEDDRIVCEGCHSRLLAVCQFYSYIRMLVVGVVPAVAVDGTLQSPKASAFPPSVMARRSSSHHPDLFPGGDIGAGATTAPFALASSAEAYARRASLQVPHAQKSRGHARNTSTSSAWSVNSDRTAASDAASAYSDTDDEAKSPKSSTHVVTGIMARTTAAMKSPTQQQQMSPPLAADQPARRSESTMPPAAVLKQPLLQNQHVLNTALWLDICKLRQRMFLARLGVSPSAMDSQLDRSTSPPNATPAPPPPIPVTPRKDSATSSQLPAGFATPPRIHPPPVRINVTSSTPAMATAITTARPPAPTTPTSATAPTAASRRMSAGQQSDGSRRPSMASEYMVPADFISTSVSNTSDSDNDDDDDHHHRHQQQQAAARTVAAAARHLSRAQYPPSVIVPPFPGSNAKAAVVSPRSSMTTTTTPVTAIPPPPSSATLPMAQ